jgi:hypothetical protein
MIRRLLLAACLVTPVDSASSQERECAGCLVAKRVVRLEIDRSGPQVVAGGIVDVIRLQSGEYVVGPVNEEKQLALFSSDGRLVKTVGRAGRGPGEFHTITRVFRGLGDSVLVYDAGNGRLSIVSSSLRFVRSIPLPNHQSLIHGNGWLIGTGPGANDVTIGRGLHVHSGMDGGLRRRIPLPQKPPARANADHADSSFARGTIARAGDQAFWFFRISDSLIVLFDLNGAKRQQLRFAPSWHSFPLERAPLSVAAPQRGELPAMLGKPTRPWSGVGAIDVDSAGLLWMWGSVPRAGWEGRPSPFQLFAPEGTKRSMVRPDRTDLLERLNGWFEGRVEVVDLSGVKPRSMGTATLSAGYILPLGSRHVAGLGVHDDGAVFIDVWRVDLEASGSAPPRKERRSRFP